MSNLFQKTEKFQRYHIQFQSHNNDWMTKSILAIDTSYDEALIIFNTFPTIFAAKRLVTVITKIKELIKVDKVSTIGIDEQTLDETPS